jgi:hypothetical protein
MLAQHDLDPALTNGVIVWSKRGSSYRNVESQLDLDDLGFRPSSVTSER